MSPLELKSTLSSGLLSFLVTDSDANGDFRADTFVKRLEWLAPYRASALFAAGNSTAFIPVDSTLLRERCVREEAFLEDGFETPAQFLGEFLQAMEREDGGVGAGGQGRREPTLLRLTKGWFRGELKAVSLIDDSQVRLTSWASTP